VETCGSRAGTAVLETWVAFAKALGDAVIQGDTAIAGAAVIQGDTTVVVAIQGDTTVVAFAKAIVGAGAVFQGDRSNRVARSSAIDMLTAFSCCGVVNWLTDCATVASAVFSLAGIMANGDGVEPRWP